MPLTNPNKVVTEERLSEFYGQILPYMGGMPDVLANKFSKSDIYSTEEKMIGVWTDGKPIYQKTWVNLNISCAYNTWVTIMTTSETPNIDKLLFSYVVDSSILVIPCIEIRIDGTNFKAQNTMPSTTRKINYLTLRYTKTTDSPISIGVDTDYSTDEKIVGTWIDGSPVWQKTVATGGNVPSGATLILRTAMASTGYDTILYTK